MTNLNLIIVQAPANIPVSKRKEIILFEQKRGWALVKSYNSIQKDAVGTDEKRRINLVFKKKK